MRGCTACRVRHLACDQRTVCSHCQKADRDCIRGYNVRFRHLVCHSKRRKNADYHRYEYFFDKNQAWLQPERKLRFVTEDSDAETETSEDCSDDLHQKPIGNDHASSVAPVVPQLHASGVETFGIGYQTAALSTVETQYTGFNSSVLSPPGSSSLDGWPLKSIREARLMQHFVTHIAPWLDLGDCKRHFGKVAGCMAAYSPLLTNAMLAIAALHDARVVTGGNLQEAIAYHDKCVTTLVPMLGDEDRTKDDCALMTIIILHLYEDIESGSDSRRHLQATSVFFPPKASAQTSQLRRAVFFIHLRQEIYNAYIQQRSVRINLENCEFEIPGYLSNDDFWFHQSLSIAAQASQWAFGEDLSYVRWQELCDCVTTWEDQRPATFNPIYFRARNTDEGLYWPEIAFSNDEHVAGAHFIYLSRLLLTTHDPTLPRIGPRLQAATKAMQETALSFARATVGIAITNHFIPARFTASLAIIICGSWFTDRGEQEEIISFMRETAKCSGWPRKKAEDALMSEWSWHEPEQPVICR